MISEEVSVASKRFDQGLSRGRTLLFRNRLQSRPILLDRLPARFTSDIQTIVSLRLKQQIGRKMYGGDLGLRYEKIIFALGDESPGDLKEAVGRLCPTLDCNVFLQMDDTAPSMVHSRLWYQNDGQEWLEDLFVPSSGIDRRTSALLGEASKRLSLIRDGERVVGRAAISIHSEATKHFDLVGFRAKESVLRGLYTGGEVTIGGLTSSGNQGMNGTNVFFGAVEGRASHASRFRPPILASWDLSDVFEYPEQRERWIDEQLGLLDFGALNKTDAATAKANFARLGRVLPGYMTLRIVRADQRYGNLSEVEEVDPEAAATWSKTTPLYFVSGGNRLQQLMYLERGQMTGLTKMMNAMGLDAVYLCGMEDEKNTRIPQDIEDESKYTGLLAMVIRTIRGIGCRSVVERIKVPKSALSKSLNNRLDSLIKIRAEKQALERD